MPSLVSGIRIVEKIPYKASRYKLGSLFGNDPESTQIGFSKTIGNIIDYYYLSSPDRPPWEGVPTTTTTMESDLKYAALLDHSLTLLSMGDAQSAFLLLHEATKYATSYMEQARAFTILGMLGVNPILS